MSLDIKHEEEGWRVRVESDDDADSPAEWGGIEGVCLVSFHRSFTVTVGGLTTPEDVENLGGGYEIIPLSAYIHSGVRLYTGTDSMCRFDSGQVGYVIVKKDTFTAEASVVADGLVRNWNTYLSGDVWTVVVEKLSCGKCGTWEHYESTSGIYGESNLAYEVQSWVDYLAISKDRTGGAP
jgi:hypothetical protein